MINDILTQILVHLLYQKQQQISQVPPQNVTQINSSIPVRYVRHFSPRFAGRMYEGSPLSKYLQSFSFTSPKLRDKIHKL